MKPTITDCTSSLIQVVHTDRELGQSASHRIMFHLGLAECIELASQYSMAILAANGEIFSFAVKKVFQHFFLFFKSYFT
jgi:hypothetical protein